MRHPVIDGMKRCIICEENKSIAEYSKTRSYAPYSYCKACVRKKSKYYDSTIEYIEEIYPTDSRCPITGEPFEVGPNGAVCPNSATLDRIIPELGYVSGNIAIISHRANTIKQGEKDSLIFRKVADWLDKFNKI